MSERRVSQARAALPSHGAELLPSVSVDSYNLELRDEDGAFLGDRVNKGAFRQTIDTLRKILRKTGDDPLGKKAERRAREVRDGRSAARGDAEFAGVMKRRITNPSSLAKFSIAPCRQAPTASSESLISVVTKRLAYSPCKECLVRDRRAPAARSL